MPPAERIAELEAVVERQREQIAALLGQVQELEARLAKDSHNSGKPPARDGLARKTKRLRRRGSKKPGGQLGHRGATLRLVAPPDAVVEQRPAVCAGCQRPLEPDAPVVLRERRQVQDRAPVRLVVREYQTLHVRCPACQTGTAGTLPAEAPSRAQDGPPRRALVVYLVQQHLVPYGRVRDLLADLFGARLSLGTLLGWVQQAATVLEPRDAALKPALSQVPVLHRAETGVRQAGAGGGRRGQAGAGGGRRAGGPGRMSPAPPGCPIMPSSRAAVGARPTPSASCRATRGGACTTAGTPPGPTRSVVTRGAPSIICAHCRCGKRRISRRGPRI
jgi:transposase